MDDRAKPEKPSRFPQAKRLSFVLLLIVLYGILGITTFVEAPSCLDLLGQNPPNKEVEWTRGMDFAGHITGWFRYFWWALALLEIGLAILALKGKLDPLMAPLLFLIALGGLSATGLLCYVRSLPNSVEKSYGLETRQRIFGPYKEK
jgi:hypothetical protein